MSARQLCRKVRRETKGHAVRHMPFFDAFRSLVDRFTAFCQTRGAARRAEYGRRERHDMTLRLPGAAERGLH